MFFTGTNPFERICSGASRTARRMNRSVVLTRGTLSPMICRDCDTFKTGMCARLPKDFVQQAVPRTNPIVRTKKQNYSFAIDLAHISIAKFGWLSVAPTHDDVRCGHNGRCGVSPVDPLRLSLSPAVRKLRRAQNEPASQTDIRWPCDPRHRGGGGACTRRSRSCHAAAIDG